MAPKSRKSRSRPRPAKMGRKWTQDDLVEYNIKVVYQDLETFFGITSLPPPNVTNEVLTAENYTRSMDPWARYVFVYMDRLTEPGNVEPMTISFVNTLFKVIGYETLSHQVLVGQKLHRLAIQGSHPKMDVCILKDSKFIPFVVKVDRHSRGFDPEPRLISDSIASFCNDNGIRTNDLGTEPLASQVKPGLVMDGTMPTFYKIPITPELVKAVESGKRPEMETIVRAYRPEVPRPGEGMKPLDNRRIILSCFEAFRPFVLL